MTTVTQPAASAVHRRTPPLPIVLSFYLWWIPILLQAILLAYIGLSLAEAARVGGAAWDILFIDAVPAFVIMAATTAEIICAFLMRTGHRGVRIGLLVVGLVMLMVTTSQFAPLTSLTDPNPPSMTALVLFVAGTIGAIITMFTPPANAFLRGRGRPTEPRPDPDH